MADNDRAILVGISRYPELGNLNGPENDVRAFKDWLVDPGGGQVPAGNIVELCSSAFHPPGPNGPGDARPGSDQLHTPFLDLLDTANRTGARLGRRLYLYFSGHGFSPGKDLVGLFPANVRRNIQFNAIPGLGFANWLAIRPLFSEIIVVMDCCRDFVAVSGALGDPPWNFAPTDDPPAKVIFALAADFNKKAVEKEVQLDDGTKEVRGLFTFAFIEALRLAPGDHRNRVTLREVSDYVHNRLPQIMGDEYFPPHFGPIEGPDPIVLAEREIPLVEVVLGVPGVPNGIEVEIAISPHPPFMSAAIKDGEARAQLRSGLYKATVRGTKRWALIEAIGKVTFVNIV